jgi:hypothetical protein
LSELQHIYMEAGALVWTRASRLGPSLDQAFWAAATAGETAFASPSLAPPSPSSLPAMRLLMLLNNAYLLFSTTFNTLCVGAALVWSDPSCPSPRLP